jgi:dihydrofolate reductase
MALDGPSASHRQSAAHGNNSRRRHTDGQRRRRSRGIRTRRRSFPRIAIVGVDLRYRARLAGSAGPQATHRCCGAVSPKVAGLDGRDCHRPPGRWESTSLRPTSLRTRHFSAADGDEFRRWLPSAVTLIGLSQGDDMTTTYTFDVFSSLDGFGAASGDWTGYWGKQGPELLDHRLALYGDDQRMVFGANTYRAFVQMLASSTEESDVRDPWVTRMISLPATVVSTTLEEPLNWPNATLASGDAVDVVARLKEESQVPLRSHGSLSMNRALMAAGLVDRVQVTMFPVITGQTGMDPIFGGAADFDLELLENRTLDGRTQELIYRPTLH